MSFNLASSASIVWKAGAKANSTIVASTAALSKWCDEAEGFVISETRRDWITGYSSVPTGVKNALDDCVSDLAAMKVIAYDTSGYTKTREAELMLDVLRDNSNKVIAALKDFKSNDIKSVS